jgi:membrane protease YdiL (CAAX protease family)
MVRIGPNEVLLMLLSFAIVTVFAGMFTAWGWLLTRLYHRQPVFPSRPFSACPQSSWGPGWEEAGDSLAKRTEPVSGDRGPPWGGWSVLLVIVVYFVVSILVGETYAVATGRVVLRRNKADAAKVARPALAPAPKSAIKTEASEFAMTEIMFVNAAANVILLVAVPCLLYLTSGTRLSDLGLSRRRWWRPVAAGVIGMLITTPAVWLVQLAAIKIWEPRGHPLEKMLREQFTFDVAYLAIVSAVILAPMVEELLFRAIIQQWLIKVMKRRAAKSEDGGPFREQLDPARPEPPSPRSADSNAGDEPLGRPFSDPIRCEPRLEGSAQGLGSTARPAAELHFWEADDPMAPPGGAPVAPSKANINLATKRAVVLTSLCFALLHAPQWPAPIPIFVLSLVLGTLYVRTGSLIAPIVMHAAFNGLSTIAMFVALLSHGVIDETKLPPPEAMPVCIEPISREAMASGETGARGLIKREFLWFFCRRN